MGYRGLTPTIPLCNDLKAIKERLIKQLFYNYYIKLETVTENRNRYGKLEQHQIKLVKNWKDWRKWTSSPIKVTVPQKGDSAVPKKGDSAVPKKGDSKLFLVY